MSISDQNFGRSSRLGRHFLDRVEERDVDIMLLEEISCEPGFQNLVASLTLDSNTAWSFLEACNSVSPVSGGESDLIALFENGDRVAAVMIENKITAHFMPEQASRYRLRGDKGIETGIWSEYVTVLVAPQRYLQADHQGHVFDRYVAYEDLLQHFQRADAGFRGMWRAGLLERAFTGAKSSVYNRVPDEVTTAFFHDYWAIASSEFPDLRMKRDKDRPAKSTWVRFYPDVGLPTHVTLWHKQVETDAADVSLNFAHTKVEDLHAAIGQLVGSDMSVRQKGGSAVIQINAGPLSISAGCEAQRQKVIGHLAAARRLSAFFADNRPLLSAVPHNL